MNGSKLNLKDFVSATMDSDIIVLSETWATDINSAQLKGYCSYYFNRPNLSERARRGSGGIAIFVKTEVNYRIKIIKSHEDKYVWLQLNCFDHSLFVACVYFPPGCVPREQSEDTSVLDLLMSDIVWIKDEFGGDSIISMCGDFNCRVGVEHDYITNDTDAHIPLPLDYTVDVPLARSSMDPLCRSEGVTLLNFCKQCEVRILNGRTGKDSGVGLYTYASTSVHVDGNDEQSATGRGRSVLDYVMVEADKLKNFTAFEIGDHYALSDHFPLLWEFTDFVPAVDPNAGVDYDFKTRKLPSWDSGKSGDVQSAVRDLIPGLCSALDNCGPGQLGIDELTHCIADRLFKATESVLINNGDLNDNTEAPTDNIPTDNAAAEGNRDIDPRTLFRVRVQRRHEPWFCETCGDLRSRMLFHLQRYRFNPHSDMNYTRMTQSSRVYNKHQDSCKREYRRQRTRRVKQARLEDSRLYWRLLEDCRRSQQDISLASYVKHFECINNPVDIGAFQCREEVINFVSNASTEYVGPDISSLDLPFTEEEVRKSIKSAKNSKSAGSDGLIYEIIKCTPELVPVITRYFNKILIGRCFPSKWTEGIIVPVFKKGDPNVLGNYRGLSMLDILSKLFTKTLNTRVLIWSEVNNKLADCQFGFRADSSAVDGIFCLDNIIEHWTKRNGRTLYCCMLDIKKAFDFVAYDNLWYKLINAGILGNVLAIIRSMYRQMCNRIRTRGLYSYPFAGVIGLRQGESLSPLLYSYIINELQKCLNVGDKALRWEGVCVALILYADDGAVLAESVADLQVCMNTVSTYCKDWNIQLNTEKSEIIVFGGDPDHEPDIYYNGERLKVVTTFKYLGLTIASGGGWIANTKNLLNQARKALMSLRRKTYGFLFNAADKYMLFRQLIEPILSYGAELWGHIAAKEIEIFHRKYMREILGVRTSTKCDHVYIELGTMPLVYMRYIRVINYWARMATSTRTRLSDRLFGIIKSRHGMAWCRGVRKVLRRYQMLHMWNDGINETLHSFQATVRKLVWDTELEAIRVRVGQAAGHSNWYRHLMPETGRFKYPKYMDALNPKHHKIMSQLRLSNIKIRSITGAWVGEDRDLRFCSHCRFHAVDDEMHFLLECPQLEILRRRYLPPSVLTNRSFVKCVELVNSVNPRVLNRLCDFMVKGFRVRSEAAEVQGRGPP